MKYSLAFIIFFAFLKAQSQSNLKANPLPAVIFGEIKFDNPVDTLNVTFLENFFYPNAKIPLPLKFDLTTTPGNLFEGTIDEKTFRIELPPFSTTGYINLNAKGYRFINMFLIEPGDSILVHINTKDALMAFSGKSAEKFRVQYELMLAGEVQKLKSDPIMLSYSKTGSRERFLDDSLNHLLYTNAITKASLGYGRVLRYINPGGEEIEYFSELYAHNIEDTEKWKVLMRNINVLSADFFNILKANIVGEFFGQRVDFLKRHIQSNDARVNSFYNDYLKSYPFNNFSDSTIIHAESYLTYLMNHAILIALKEKKGMFEVVKKHFSGEIRDRITGRFIVQNFKRLEDGDKTILKALEFIETPWIRKELEYLYETQKVGSAIDFELENTKGDMVKLSDFKGKVVLIDYWFTGCGGCVILYKKSLTKVIDHFSKHPDFVKISVSADANRDTWLKSILGGNYTSSSSVNLTTSGFQHTLLRKYNIHSYPYLMLIDKNGKMARSGGLNLPANDLIEIINQEIKK